MNNLKTFFIITLSLVVFPFEHGWCIEPSPAEAAYQACLIGDKEQQKAYIERLVAMSDEGVPYLEKLLKIIEQKESSRDRVSVPYLIDAVARVGTDKAADVLMGGALRYKSRIGYPAFGPVWVKALAGMGKRGLDRLLILSNQTETYREPWLALEFRAEKFIWFPKKQSRPTQIALEARKAIASVSAPAAMQPVGTLIDSPEHDIRHSALLALTATKTAGYEDKALRIWQNNNDASALKYLLVVDREKYLPILQEKLKVLDDEVVRIVRDLADLRARRVRDYPSDHSVIHLVFDLGGDPVANPTLRRYIDSKLWDRYQGSTVAVAIMALGLSRDSDAKPALVGLLKDSTILDVSTAYPFGRYSLNGSGRGSGTPMFILAVQALGALGDPSVIPLLEQHESVNDPLFKRCFENTLSTLRAARKTNQ
jgi:hypothetical protein